MESNKGVNLPEVTIRDITVIYSEEKYRGEYELGQSVRWRMPHNDTELYMSRA